MPKKQTTVDDVIAIMNEIAPPELAESWDNAGLQVGDRRWIAKRVRVALDPLFEVVDQACRDNVDMLITHHPLLFRPLKRLDPSTPVGKIVRMAMENELAVFSAHTNLDSAEGGLNDYLSESIGLNNVKALQVSQGPGTCKLVVFVPRKIQREAMASLFSSGAGKIGAYDCCSFRCEGIGTFMPQEGAEPFSGKPGRLSEAEEVRLEAVAREADVLNILENLRKIHPYQTMAYDAYKLSSLEGPGLGRVGELDTPLSLEKFASRVKKKLGLPYVRAAGDPKLAVERVAVCSGSGSGLMRSFFSSKAQVYVSGDLHYHDARDVEAAGRGLVDIGHFGSERIVVELLVDRLRKAFDRGGLDAVAEACELEKDPFNLV